MAVEGRPFAEGLSGRGRNAAEGVEGLETRVREVPRGCAVYGGIMVGNMV